MLYDNGTRVPECANGSIITFSLRRVNLRFIQPHRSPPPSPEKTLSTPDGYDKMIDRKR